jgi:glycosyltransferase involved in cell wall biosynthesis
MNKYRVALVIPTLGLGGTERQLTLLAEGLRDSEFTPIVFTLFNEGPYKAELERLGIEIQSINARSIYDLPGWLRFRSRLKKCSPDIVHTFLFDGNAWGGMAAWMSGTPFITSRRDMDIWKKKRHHALEAWLSKRSAGVVANSQAARSYCLNNESVYNPDIYTVIHNGLKSFIINDANDKADNPPIKLLCAGTLSRKKNQACLIRSVASLVGQGKQIELTLLGSGPEEGNLRQLVESHSANSVVKFMSPVDDIYEVLRKHHLLVIPSLYESLPNVMLEAMNCGLPVLAARVGGIPELIESGETGILVDKPEETQLAKAIEDVIKGRYDLECIRQKAYEKVREMCSWEHMTAAYRQLYISIVK